VNINNKCTSSNRETSSSDDFLVAGRLSIISTGTDDLLSSVTLSCVRWQSPRIDIGGSASLIEREFSGLWISLLEAGASLTRLLSRAVSGALSAGLPVRPTRFRYAIGRPKPILLRSQNCLHFGDLGPGRAIIRNPAKAGRLFSQSHETTRFRTANTGNSHLWMWIDEEETKTNAKRIDSNKSREKKETD
jgi:hypothetical protein